MPARRWAADARTVELFTAKLASSGLDLDDAQRLGLEPLPPAIVGQYKWAEARPSLRINYFDTDGSALSDVPCAAPFFRLRYLDRVHGFSVQQEKGRKEIRYVQPPRTAPCVYLPRSVDWDDIMPDVERRLIITEGELKAACACKFGFDTIGLGGVWNFRSVERGIEFIPTLERFEWPHRDVYIIFDSDLASNANVLAALNELAYELERRGAVCHVVWLPDVLGPDEKVGLDDFLVFHGDEAEAELAKLLKGADTLGLVKALFVLNERYVYVADPGLLVDTKTRARHRPGALKEHLAAPTTVRVAKLGSDGSVRYERASAGGEWLKWPLRRSTDKITYAPGKPRYYDERGCAYYNTWDGWGVEPKRGDVTPFLTLVRHIFTGADPDAFTWFMRWLAYPLQYPGTKLFSAAVIYGLRTGTGKSLIGYTMGKIYGANFTAIKQTDLHGNFNEWAENKQFILGDDITGSNRREDYDVLKKMLTQEMMRINPKYVPTYEVPDCLSYLFTSNQPDLFAVEDDDRRLFFHEVLVGPMSEEFYMEYGLWLDSGGAAAIFDYLLHLDTGSFNPAAHAFRTAARERMIADVRTDLASWCRMLMNDPDNVLKLGEVVVAKELFTAKELLSFYDPLGRTSTTANGIGRELRRAGATMVNHGKPVKWAGGYDRYYAMRRRDHWAVADLKVVTDYLAKTLQPAAGRLAKY